MSTLLLRHLRIGLLNRSSGIILNKAVPPKYFSSKPVNHTFNNGEETKEKKKTVPIPKITLLYSDNDDITVTTLEEAKKISKRRDLKLVKLVDFDTKTQRPVYKLMTAAQLHIEDLKQREVKKKERQSESIKGEKILFINSGISEHDLGTHIRKILKWIAKKFEVRIVISGSENDMSVAEKVYKQLETQIGDNGRFLQKRVKNAEIKFQIIPPKIATSS